MSHHESRCAHCNSLVREKEKKRAQLDTAPSAPPGVPTRDPSAGTASLVPRPVSATGSVQPQILQSRGRVCRGQGGAATSQAAGQTSNFISKIERLLRPGECECVYKYWFWLDGKTYKMA